MKFKRYVTCFKQHVQQICAAHVCVCILEKYNNDNITITVGSTWSFCSRQRTSLTRRTYTLCTAESSHLLLDYTCSEVSTTLCKSVWIVPVRIEHSVIYYARMLNRTVAFRLSNGRRSPDDDIYIYPRPRWTRSDKRARARRQQGGPPRHLNILRVASCSSRS